MPRRRRSLMLVAMLARAGLTVVELSGASHATATRTVTRGPGWLGAVAPRRRRHRGVSPRRAVTVWQIAS